MYETKEESSIAVEWDEKEQARGFISSDANGKLLIDTMTHNNLPMTAANLTACLEALVNAGHKMFKSKARMEAERLYNELSPENQARFSKWFGRQGRQIVVEMSDTEDRGYENVALFLTRLRGFEIDDRTCQNALGNIATSSKARLHWAPSTETYVKGQYSDHKFPNRRTEDEARANGGGLKNWARDEEFMKRNQGSRPGSTEPSQAYWMVRAEKAAGMANLKSHRDELARMVVNKQGSSEVDYQATALARERVAKKNASGGW
jgi:hypothetical protein